ncbi:MAG: lytic transglycosylase domain-containing protein [Rhodospirillaceae bacterium]|nr:lytic transglycosylase domain-containing protein [Rhodospirillaceae bacterium]
MIHERFLRAGLPRRFWQLLSGALLLAIALSGSPLQAQDVLAPALPKTASLPIGTEDGTPEVVTPTPLEAVDAARYRQIFELQAAAQWLEADAVIDRLTDLRLLGHVLADRYLSPTYRTSYRELRDWLVRYGDHPDAPRLYDLALSRLPAGTEAPPEPTVSTFRGGTPDNGMGAESSAWSAGIEAWRNNDPVSSAALFVQAAGEAKDIWTRSAASYWAARSYLRARQPEEVSRWLRIAAEEPRSFYGQLARRALGLDASFDWRPLSLSTEGAQSLLKSRIGQRALGLLQIGQERRAAAEFHVLRPKASPVLLEAMLAVAQRYGLPSFVMTAGSVVEEVTGGRIDEALYPLPQWEPHGGFSIDRALLYSIARQESGFNPTAQNPSGATGLMQIIPSTANAVAKQLGISGHDLRDPVMSLTLGQEYLRMLLADANVANDLFLMTIAYNAGPGNLAKWRKQFAYDDDPLLFIESIPSRETRLFVERVMAGLWIYQARLGQPALSLDAVASGAWPTYQSQDAPTLAASDAAN